MKNKRGFTLIELVSVLVILAILALIVIPLVLNIIRKAQIAANKRSVDYYGRSVEIALATYLLDIGKYPTDIDSLNIQYKGKEVKCEEKELNDDGTIFLSKCMVGKKYVKDSSNKDGYYHYGKLELTAVKELIEKANDIEIIDYDDGDKYEMYTFSHDATEQTSELIDYRYIGLNPKNYVLIDNELWRIIGIFEVENEFGKIEKRIKLLKDISLYERMPWYPAEYANDWIKSDLNIYLNGEYYDNLTESFKKLISPVKYYLGGISSTDYKNGSDYYNAERGTTVYSGRSINTINKIGLMYPSDYVYTYAYGVDDVCFSNGGFSGCGSSSSGKSNGWIYTGYNIFWTMTPRLRYQYSVYIASSGYVNSSTDNGRYSIRPVVYLKPKVKIVKGTGTMADPYEFSL